MIYLVASIHHTGTKLVYEKILAHTEAKIRIHLELDFLQDLTACRNCKIIVPMLHPKKVFIGWKLRKKSLDELLVQYDLLINLVNEWGVNYLPIDHENRDMWLKEIDPSLRSDWDVIGRQPGVRPELNLAEEAKLNLLMKDGFFKQFGYRS